MALDLRLAAGRVASTLGHHWLGAEHVLLALSAGEGSDRAAIALARVGVTYERGVAALLRRVAIEGAPAPRQCSGILSIDSYHTVEAAATAVTFANGRHEARSEDVLLGLLAASGVPLVNALIDDMGADPQKLSRALSVGGALINPFLNSQENAIVREAAVEALGRGSERIDTWHVMLALLAGKPDAFAKRALASRGVTYSGYARWFDEYRSTWRPPAPPPDYSMTIAAPTPNTRMLLGRALGFAHSLGDGVVRSEHGLLARLWDATGSTVVELGQLGTSSEQVLDTLVLMGASTPSMPLPRPDLTPWTSINVPQQRLEEVIASLARDFPAGGWGFNSHQGQAWVTARDGIKLGRCISALLSD